MKKYNIIFLATTIFLSGFISGSTPAFANVDVSGIEIDFSNDGIDVGADATAGQSFNYINVVPGSTPQVNAIVTVFDFTNITTLDFVDENDHSNNKPLDFQMYNIDEPDAYANLKVEFFDGSIGDGFTEPIFLDNVTVTIKDIDIYQSITVDAPLSYKLSEKPRSVLDVSLIGDSLTFSEINGDSFDDKDQEAWALLLYSSISEFNFQGFVKWGGSFTLEFKSTPFVISSSKLSIIANGYRADALGSVYFAPGSSKLSKSAQDQLKALVTANPTAIYKVTGFVQKSGTSVNDAKLSLARAKSVESYLASLGAGVTFNVVVETGLVPAKEGTSAKARKATLFAMTPVVQ